jgi:hypothetical protein
MAASAAPGDEIAPIFGFGFRCGRRRLLTGFEWAMTA